MPQATSSQSGYLDNIDWQTFNNKQNTITNPITGTGSTGRIPVFTGTRALGNSLLFDNGTRVSVGADVTTTSTFVSVSSTSGASAIIGLATGSATGITSTVQSGTIFSGQSNTGSYFLIENNANTSISGKLNIGDFATTAFRLNVVGTGNFTGALSGTSASFSGNVSASGTGNILIQAASSNNFPLFQLLDSRVGGNTWNIEGGRTLANLQFRSSIAGGTVLELASTGAATFSSSVATTRLLVGGATGNFPIDTYTTSRIGVRSWTDISGTTNNFFIQNSANFNYGVLGVVSATGTSTGDVYGLGYSASAGTAMTSVINWTSAGNVGIGTTSPSQKLTIDASNGFPFIDFKVNGTGYGDIGYNTSASAFTIGAYSTTPMEFYTNGSPRMRITSGGGVEMNNTLAIGRATESAVRLSIQSSSTDSGAYAMILRNSASTDLLVVRNDGAIYTGNGANSPYNLTTGSGANVFVESGGLLYRSTSSIKYKKNVLDYSKGLTEIMQMRAVTYEGKSKSDEGKIFAGLIAEEVHDLGLTEFVQYATDGTPDALAYSNMVSLLIKGIQELKAELDTLKN
jgi:hypothetical protein